MAGKSQLRPLTVRSYIHVGDRLVDVDTLNAAQKKYVATQLQLGVLRAEFAGRATFEADLPPAAELFADLL